MITDLLFRPDYGRARSLTAAILCAGLSGCGFGLLMPLVALNLEALSGSGALVGANAAVAALSTIVATPFIPPLLAHFKARKVIILSALIVGLGILVFPFIPVITFWFLLRFLIGIPVSIIFVASETWINQLAKPESRASLLAVYATVLLAGFGSGGLLLALLGDKGLMPWIAGASVFFVGIIPVMLLKGPELVPPKPDLTKPQVMIFIARLVPAAIIAGLVFGALETGVFALFPVYAERIGFDVTQIGILMAVGALGGIILQIPIGKLADKIGCLTVLRLISVATIIALYLLTLADTNLLAISILIFLFIGLGSGFYTLGLALIGQKVETEHLASANASFIFIYGIGSLLGPIFSGYAMDLYNPEGLLWSFMILSAAYLVLSVRERTS